MAIACSSCGGMGYGVVEPDVGHHGTDPCPDCIASLEARKAQGEPVSELGKPVPVPPERRNTLEWADAPGKSTVDDRPEPFERYFSPAEIEAQQRKDLAAMARETRR